MRRYNPQEIEPKWQKAWAESDLYKVDMSRTADKFYVIPMLPYPSGDLHVGHWYNYGPTDTVARFRRMLGQNVMTTLGFDAFGLPAENAAIKRGIQPAVWTHSNIKSMTEQIKRIGTSYDWSHSLSTCDPDYYHWNQWLFLQLYKHGLAYRAKAVVNWCPKDKTVLANEQVIGDKNICERCGTPVIQKEMESWFFKITDYADRLLVDLDSVDWPQKVKIMQTNWIGKSQGALIDFATAERRHKIQVFTTRPDTIYGATYMVLAPEHPLAEKLATPEQKGLVVEYIKKTSHKTELERKEGEKNKSGVFTGSYAINPANHEKIPIWIADYVLMGYGSGAIMAVPAHDQRDYEFAEKFDLPTKEVIEPVFVQTNEPGGVREGEPFVEREAITAIVKHPKQDKYIGLRWKSVDWETLITGGVEQGQTPEQAAIAEIQEETGYLHPKLVKTLKRSHSKFFHIPKNENRFAHFHVLYFELEDDARREISKEDQSRHEVVWLSKAEMARFRLPQSHQHAWVELTEGRAVYAGEGVMINSGKYDGLDSSVAREKIVADLVKTRIAKEQVNYRLRDWLISRQRYWGTPIPIIYCETDGPQPVPEKDLPVILPEDVEFELSGRSPLVDRPDFVNTKCPKCGKPAKRETDTMDTFVCSSWYFLRYLDNHNGKEAYANAVVNKWGPVDHYIGGIEHAILHLMYARFIVKFLHDYYGLKFEEPFKKLTNQGIILGPDGHKMSKSRGNVVSPDEQVKSYGADSLRLYLMFMGPYDIGGPYNLGGIVGTRRFLERVWSLVGEFNKAKPSAENHVNEVELTAATQRTVKKVTQDLEQLGFNTAIAAMMGFVNDLYKLRGNKAVPSNQGWLTALETLVQLLAPFAPHIAEEMWYELGHESSVHVSNWPIWDEALVKEEMLTLVVQINGKVRAQIILASDIDEKAAIAAAKEDKHIAELIKGKTIKKTVYVPGRLVSLVVA